MKFFLMIITKNVMQLIIIIIIIMIMIIIIIINIIFTKKNYAEVTELGPDGLPPGRPMKREEARYIIIIILLWFFLVFNHFNFFFLDFKFKSENLNFLCLWRWASWRLWYYFGASLWVSLSNAGVRRIIMLIIGWNYYSKHVYWTMWYK